MTARSTRTTTDRVRALIVGTEDKRDYDGPSLVFRTSSVTCLVAEGRATGVKNITDSQDRSPDLASTAKGPLADGDLADYEVSSRCSLDKYTDGNPPQWHERADYYSPFCVDLPRAERMVRALRKIDRRRRQSDIGGYWWPTTASPGTFIAKMAAVLGVQAILFEAGRTGEWGHAGVIYDVVSIEEAKGRIDATYAAWVSRVAPAHASAAS